MSVPALARSAADHLPRLLSEAHAAAKRSSRGWDELARVGGLLEDLARQMAAPAVALDAALCLRGGIAENELARAQTLVAALHVPAAADDPDLPAAYALAALAERWDLIRPLAPSQLAETLRTPLGPGDLASATARALWHHAWRQADTAAAAPAAEERAAWRQVQELIQPHKYTWAAMRCNLLWMVLCVYPEDWQEYGAMRRRLQNLGWTIRHGQRRIGPDLARGCEDSRPLRVGWWIARDGRDIPSGDGAQIGARAALKAAWGMHTQIMVCAAAGWQIAHGGEYWLGVHPQRGERRAETLDGLLAMIDAPHPTAVRRPRGGTHGRG